MDLRDVEPKGGLLAVSGHSIYHRGKWHGGFPGEDSFYAAHVAAGIRLRHEHGYDYICFSGGCTRPRLEAQTDGISEAEGMENFALEKGLIVRGDPRVITDRHSRDSFENCFFSILAFYRRTAKWPSRVGIISWASKGLRYHLIAAGLGLGGRVRFYGVGDYPNQADLERACAAEARLVSKMADVADESPSHQLTDPLFRDEAEFGRKRWNRMPRTFTPDARGDDDYMREVKAAYGAHDVYVRELIDRVHRLTPGDGWRHIAWPWLSQPLDEA